MELTVNIKSSKYNQKTVLKDVQLSFKENGLYGFFGKNGAGKSTFLRCLAGLKSFEGEITLDNDKLKPNEVAWIPTEPDIYEYLTGKEFCDFIRKLSGKQAISKEYFFDIDDTVLMVNYSTGTRKKAFINAILQFNDYKVYVFDEPFNGLDIESNYQLLNKIRTLSESNIVLVSSHIIEIVAPYLKQAFIVDKQNVLALEHTEQLTEHFFKER